MDLWAYRYDPRKDAVWFQRCLEPERAWGCCAQAGARRWGARWGNTWSLRMRMILWGSPFSCSVRMAYTLHPFFFFFLSCEDFYFSFASRRHSNLLEERRREFASSGPGSEQLTCWPSSPPSFAELCPCRQVTGPGAVGRAQQPGLSGSPKAPKKAKPGGRSCCPRRHKRCRCPVLSRK